MRLIQISLVSKPLNQMSTAPEYNNTLVELINLEQIMNKDILEGNWEELKGKIKQQWGKLTDDDLTQLKGNQQELSGKLQKHYGYTKEESEDVIKRFKDKLQ